MPATYEKISTTTLGSDTSDINFTSIGSGYTDLRLVLTYIHSGGGYNRVRLNSDTGSNYSDTVLYSLGSYQDTGATYIDFGSGLGTGNSTTPAFLTLDIFSYAGSTFKTILGTLSSDNNGAGYVVRTVGLWRSTSAITSVNLVSMGSGNYKTGTTATLYGILKA